MPATLPTPRQRSLALAVPCETPLVEIGTVRAVRRVDADTIHDEVDEGKYRWVWNVSALRGEIRELRFWTRELHEPAAVANLSVPEVVNQILGPQAEWRGPEIAQLLIVSRPTVHRLQAELGAVLVGGVIKCRRDGLARWLKARLQ